MPLPGDLTVITVTATYQQIDGTLAAAGTITFDPSDVITDSTGKVVFGQAATAQVTDGQLTANGSPGIVLPCTDNASLIPSGFSYTVTEVITGWKRRTYKIQLPSSLGETADLSQLSASGGGAGVSEVNGKSGAVTLVAADLGAVDKAGDTMGGKLAPKVAVLTDAATIAVDASLGNDFRVTLAGNRTIAAPSNPSDGQSVTFEIIQDATGSRTLTWASGTGGFAFGAGVAPALSTAAGVTDIAAFRYSSAKGEWLYLGSGLGF